jgi:hypothetical protein
MITIHSHYNYSPREKKANPMKNNKVYVILLSFFLVLSFLSYGIESDLKKRPEPLRELATTATMKAENFGVKPDTGEDMAPALKRLTNHLATLREPTTVSFKKGVYLVSGGRAAFDFNELNNLVIDGRGAEFIIQSPGTDFTKSKNCKNIIFRNFVIDGDPLPFTQGKIVGIHTENGTFDLKIDPGYQGLGEGNLSYTHSLSRRWGMLKDPKFPGRLKRGVPNHFIIELSAEDLGDHTYRLRLMKASQINNFSVGGRYVQQINGVAPRNHIQECSDITYENITMYCAGASYVGTGNKNINILSCQTILKDDRLASSTADGILLQACENGPWVEKVIFEGISDDALNLYQKPIWVKQVISERRLLLVPGNTPFSVGDMLTFFNPVEGKVLARLQIISTINKQEGVETVFDGDVPKLRVGSAQVLGGGARGKTLEGAGMNSTQVYNEKFISGPAVVRNCVFKNSRNMAVKLQSNNVIFENNIIEGWDNVAIFIANLVDYPEGFLGNNFIIRNNLIRDGGFNSSRGGGIYFRFAALEGKPSESADMRNIVISGNVIINPGSWAINGASFAETEIHKNTIIFSDLSNRPGAITLLNTPHSSCTENNIFILGSQEFTGKVILDKNVKNEGNVILSDINDAKIEKIEKEWRERNEIIEK